MISLTAMMILFYIRRWWSHGFSSILFFTKLTVYVYTIQHDVVYYISKLNVYILVYISPSFLSWSSRWELNLSLIMMKNKFLLPSLIFLVAYLYFFNRLNPCSHDWVLVPWISENVGNLGWYRHAGFSRGIQVAFWYAYEFKKQLLFFSLETYQILWCRFL